MTNQPSTFGAADWDREALPHEIAHLATLGYSVEPHFNRGFARRGLLVVRSPSGALLSGAGHPSEAVAFGCARRDYLLSGGTFPADALDVVADMARPYGFTVEGGGAVPTYLCRHTANRRAVTIGTDGPLEQASPSLPLFLIGGIMLEGDDMPEVGNRHPAPLPLALALERGSSEARAIDSEAFPLLAREFPDYPIGSLPSIPAHWVDRSWKQEPCPTFQIGHADGQIVFTDYPRPADREFPDMKRFTVHSLDQNGQLGTDSMVLETDDWAEVLTEVEFNERMGRLRSGKLTREDAEALLAGDGKEGKPCPDLAAYLRSFLDGGNA